MENMTKHMIDIGHKDIDIYVDGELMLHIGQVSDGDTINLFLYPEGDIMESLIHQEDPNADCTHEILKARQPKT